MKKALASGVLMAATVAADKCIPDMNRWKGATFESFNNRWPDRVVEKCVLVQEIEASKKNEFCTICEKSGK